MAEIVEEKLAESSRSNQSSKTSQSRSTVIALSLFSAAAFLLLAWISWSVLTPKVQVKDSHGVLVQPGDVLSFNRGLYNHIALAVDGGSAVHLTGDGQDFDLPGVMIGSASGGSSYATVRHDAILEIAGQDPFLILNHVWDKSLKSRDEVVRLALGRVGEKRTYNLATGNCEHFVNDLILGRASSQQVMDVVSTLLCLAIGLLITWFRIRIFCGIKCVCRLISNKNSADVNSDAKLNVNL